MAKFSRHRFETAADWVGVVNLVEPERRVVTGVDRSLKKSDDCCCLPVDLGVRWMVEVIL